MIFVGDCLEWLATLEDGSVDHAFADPPYSEHVHAKSMRAGGKGIRQDTKRRQVRRAPIARDLGFLPLTPELQRDVACELARVVRRWVLVFCNVELVSPWIYALQGAGLPLLGPRAAWPRLRADVRVGQAELLAAIHGRPTRERV